MKLRSGVQIAQVANGAIAQNPKTFQAIAEHNASSYILMLPQEIKNRIYHFVTGGRKVHILAIDEDHQHFHGDGTVKLSHALCIEHMSEEQVQKDFDSADPDVVGWNIGAIPDRHEICHRPPPEHQKGSNPNQLDLSLLRSCRQIYLEAKMVHYTNNTFAISCHDILDRFVRARFQNKQNSAIRSLHLDVGVIHPNGVDAWSASINKSVLRRLKSVRCLHLNLVQMYCHCAVEAFGYEEALTERQRKMFKRLSKLPLKEVTLTIDDSEFFAAFDPDQVTSYYIELEEFRWTFGQKQEFSREIRDALLG